MDVGEIGFLSDIDIVDLAGLTDPVIAHAPGGLRAKAFDSNYLIHVRRPDVVLVRLARDPLPTDPAATSLALTPYAKVASYLRSLPMVGTVYPPWLFAASR